MPFVGQHYCVPAEVENSDYSTSESITGVAFETVQVTCDQGYNGSGTAVCQPSGTFIVPDCSGKFKIAQQPHECPVCVHSCPLYSTYLPLVSPYGCAPYITSMTLHNLLHLPGNETIQFSFEGNL